MSIITKITNLILDFADKRKIKFIVQIYKKLKSTHGEMLENSVLQETAHKYFSLLKWDALQINSSIKAIFDPLGTGKPQMDIKMLAPWLLAFEEPFIPHRFQKRYQIASELVSDS